MYFDSNHIPTPPENEPLSDSALPEDVVAAWGVRATAIRQRFDERIAELK